MPQDQAPINAIPPIPPMPGYTPNSSGNSDLATKAPRQKRQQGLQQAPQIDQNKLRDIVRPVTRPMTQDPVVDSEDGFYLKWTKNIGDILDGLADLPGAVAKGFTELPDALRTIYRSYSQDPKTSWDITWPVVREVIPFAGSTYRNKQGEWSVMSALKGGAENAPLAVLDALSVFSLGTSAGVKASTRMAALAGKAGNAEALAAWSGRAKMFTELGDLPTNAAKAAIRGVESIPPLKNIETWLGYTPEVRAEAKIKALHYNEASREFEDLGLKAVKQSIDPAKHDLLEDVIDHLAPLRSADWTPEEMNKIKAISDMVSHGERAMQEERVLKLGRETINEQTANGLWEGARNNKAALRLHESSVAAENGFASRAEMRQFLVDADSTLKNLPRQVTAGGRSAVKAARDRSFKIRNELNKGPSEATLAAATERRAGTIALSDMEGNGDVQRRLYRPFVPWNPMDVNQNLHDLLMPARGLGDQYAANLNRAHLAGAIINDPDIYAAHYATNTARVVGRSRWIKDLYERHGLMRPAEELAPAGYRAVTLPLDKYLDHTQMTAKFLQNRLGELKGLEIGTPEFSQAVFRIMNDVGHDLTAAGVHEVFDAFASKKDALHLPNDIARMVEQELAPTGGFARTYDKLMDAWRAAILTLSPRFYINNLLGNSVLQTIYGIPAFSGRGIEAERLPAEIAKIGQGIAESGDISWLGRQPWWKGVKKTSDWMMEKIDKPAHSGIYGAEVEKILARNPKIKQVVEMAAGPEISKQVGYVTQIRETVAKMRSQLLSDPLLPKSTAGGPLALRELIEKSAQKGELLKQLEPLAAVADQGMAARDLFLGAYGRLTPFEQKFVRRVIPFWTFAKTMHELAFWMPLVRPNTTMAMSKMAGLALQAIDDENLPDYLKGTIHFGVGKSGKMYFVRVNGLNVFDSIGMREFGRVPIPKLADPSQNPLVAAFMKGTGSYDQFAHNPPPLEADEIIDATGHVWRYDPAKGKPVKVSPETPLTDILFETIPQTSIWNDFAAWAGFPTFGAKAPKVYTDADGNAVNPPHWSKALARMMGAPWDSVDVGRSQVMDRLRIVRQVKGLVKKAIYSPNEYDRSRVLKEAYVILKDLGYQVQ